MKIKIKKLSENARIPTRATSGSAGADIYACLENDTVIPPHGTVMIPTGIAIQPKGSECGAFIFPRSSLSSRYSVTLANCVGVVDSDYTGEIKIPLINHSDTAYTVRNGDRIAQLVMLPVILPRFEESTELDETERGEGGFGSTGI